MGGLWLLRTSEWISLGLQGNDETSKHHYREFQEHRRDGLNRAEKVGD